MRLKTEHLYGRQIFRSPRLAQGATWKSPSTGRALTVVGCSGDADDPGRGDALFAHDYYHYHAGALTLAYPELESAFEPMPKEARTHQKFLLARRVSEDGWCRQENEVICVPYHGRHGVYDVDLVGYGPTAWLPDGISGQEILERPFEPWRALAIWRDPGRMVSIASLQYGWVIRSEQFARARPRFAPKPDGMFILYQDTGREDLDEARGKAGYVVERLDPEEDWEWDSGPEDYSYMRVLLRRLNESGAYDPTGETIEFRQTRHRGDGTCHVTRNSPFQPVELLGRMAFDGRLVSEPLPQPLAF